MIVCNPPTHSSWPIGMGIDKRKMNILLDKVTIVPRIEFYKAMELLLYVHY